MFEMVGRVREELADVRTFAEIVSNGVGPFSAESPIFVARAPGRLDVMGGIADYSGSLVLQMPIREACVAGVQTGTDGIIQVASLDGERKHSFEIAADRIGELRNDAHRGRWYSYVAGVFTILSDAGACDISGGARVLVRSDVPIGKGVSPPVSRQASVR